jgi:hypothetical protein
MNIYLIIFIATYLVGTLLISNLTTNNKTSHLTSFKFAATIVPTWYGLILGAIEFYSHHGFAGWLGFSACYHVHFALMIFLIPIIKKLPQQSWPELFSSYYSPVVGKISAFLIIIHTSSTPYILAATILLESITGLNFTLCLSIILLYVLLIQYKQTKSVYISNFIDFIIMLSGLVIVLTINYKQFDITQIFVFKNQQDYSKYKIFLGYIIASSIYVDQNFYNRIKNCKNIKTARYGMLISLTIFLIIDAILLIISNSNLIFIHHEYKLIFRQANNHLNLLIFITILSSSLSTAISHWHTSTEMMQKYFIPHKLESNLILALVNLALIYNTRSIISIWFWAGMFSVPILLLLQVNYFIRNYGLINILTKSFTSTNNRC